MHTPTISIPYVPKDAAKAEATDLAVLIVDDEKSTCSLCGDIAREAGLKVHFAETTEEALELLDRSAVDILLTDLKVPELGGLELLKRVRTHYPHVATIVLTQYGTIETAIEATRLGACDYVTKPFHVEELRSKLDRLISARKTGYCASNCARGPASAG